MSWIKKLIPSKVRTQAAHKRNIPEGVWCKCDKCKSVLYSEELNKSEQVCPRCGYHQYISARERLKCFFDQGQFQEIAADVEAVDRLKFKDSKKYKDRLLAAQKLTGEKEALVCGLGKLKHMSLVACAFEYKFIGGSMGSAVGERFVQGINQALKHQVPFVCFSVSGGARMQEGLISLMQMAKTSAALKKLANAKLPYISVLTNPTMGGVSASLAMLGDVILAEPDALIGFAGPRVIAQTVRETLPPGFQRSEFLLSHGHIDTIVDRREMRDEVAAFLAKFMHKKTA